MLAIVASILCLTNNISVVFPHIYYLPIILVVYWYLKRGMMAVIGLAGMYLVIVYVFAPETLINAAIRACVFLLIGLVVLLLSLRIQEEKMKYFCLFNNSEAGNVLFDISSRTILQANTKFSSMTGYEEDKIAGCPLEKIIRDENKLHELIVHFRSVGSFSNFPVQLTGKNGKVIEGLLSANPFSHHELSATVVDITVQKRALEELNAANEYLEKIIDFSPDATFVIDQEGKIIFWNKELEIMSSLSKEQMIGHTTSALATRFFDQDRPLLADIALNGDEAFLAAYETYAKTNSTVSAEADVLHVYGNLQGHVWAAASPLIDNKGNLIGAIESIRDISSQKALENRLKTALEETKRSNADLEQFAYVASHDLQEPLRMISSYLQLLERKYRGNLDADADLYIHYAVDGAQRMQALINDLLEFSRVAKRGKPFEPVNCEDMFVTLLKDMSLAIEDSGAMITHDELPSIVADSYQIAMVVRNLIGNAIKYRGDEPPRIHVAARRQEDEWLFSVKDNGIGFDPKYSERIFKIFQRLHTREEYPGMGIGLAICRRIVERHGGSIWAESEAGVGSTFSFTIPVRSVDDNEQL